MTIINLIGNKIPELNDIESIHEIDGTEDIPCVPFFPDSSLVLRIPPNTVKSDIAHAIKTIKQNENVLRVYIVDPTNELTEKQENAIYKHSDDNGRTAHRLLHDCLFSWDDITTPKLRTIINKKLSSIVDYNAISEYSKERPGLENLCVEMEQLGEAGVAVLRRAVERGVEIPEMYNWYTEWAEKDAETTITKEQKTEEQMLAYLVEIYAAVDPRIKPSENSFVTESEPLNEAGNAMLEQALKLNIKKSDICNWYTEWVKTAKTKAPNTLRLSVITAGTPGVKTEILEY